VLAGDEFLEHVSAHPQGPFPEVLAARIEAVEGHEERWGGGVVLRAPRSHSTWETRWRSKTAISPSSRSVGGSSPATAVASSVAADEPRAGGVFVGEHAPAVDFLLEDPAGAVEGALYFGRGHRRLDERQGSGHRWSIRGVMQARWAEDLLRSVLLAS